MSDRVGRADSHRRARGGAGRTGRDRSDPERTRRERGGPDHRGAAGGSEPAELTVPVRVKPGSSRTRVGGRFDGPYGPALVIAVHQPAVDGRATDAARRALAEALGLRPAAVTLRTGTASRDKLFRVDGIGSVTDERLRHLRDGSAE